MARDYYNEHDPFAAAWLRNLIAAGELPDGDVDERSIEDVAPADLAGYRHCHFFAGIGGWPLAMRLAGWPDALPFLVRVCDIVGPEGALCGKPALYRYGSHGRCRAHKALIPEESRRAYLQRDQNAGAKNALYRDADREQDARRAFHAACGRNNNRRKP